MRILKKLDARISDCRVSCSFPGSLKTFTNCNLGIDSQRLKVLSFSTLLQFFEYFSRILIFSTLYSPESF